MTKYLPALLLFIVPLGFLAEGGLHAGHFLAMLAGATVLAALQYRCRFLFLFSVYVVGMIIYCYAGATYGFLERTFEQRAVRANYVFLMAATIYGAAYSAKLSKSAWFNLFCLAGLLQAAIAWCQWLWVDPIAETLKLFIPLQYDLGAEKVYGTLGNNNNLSAWLCITIPFFLRGYWHLGLVFVLPILAVANTSTAVIALAVGAAYFYRSYWKIIVPVAIGTTVLFVFAIDNSPLSFTKFSTFSQRFTDWGHVMRQMMDTPISFIFGFGPNAAWRYMYPIHNEWLTILHQYGIIGLGLVVAHCVRRPRVDDHLVGAFVIICILACGNYILQLPALAVMVLTVSAVGGKYGKFETASEVKNNPGKCYYSSSGISAGSL